MFLSLTSPACSTIRLQINQFTPKKSNLPRDMKSPDEDADIIKETSVLISIPNNEEFYIGKDQYSKEVMGDKIKKLIEGKTPDKRIVYIESADSVQYGTVISILNLIRKADIDKIGFVVTKINNEKVGARPTRFEVRLPAEPNEREIQKIAKPNPLTLVVEIDKTGALLLNRDSMGNLNDTTALTYKLVGIFKDRENSGVLREGTNEVEKTIFIKAPRSIKYGDVVKVIDAVKVAGSQPIGLQIDDLIE